MFHLPINLNLYEPRTNSRSSMEKSKRPNPKNVWIVGDSYIRRGEERARKTVGTSLGLDTIVHWFGWGGLRWESLLPFIHQSLRGRAAPDLLLIHCGGNDLGKIKSLDLVTGMKRDLQDLHRQSPGTKIFLSGITQRRRWRTANPGKIDKARKWVRNVMAAFVQDLGGIFVPHPHITFENDDLFLKDGVHFTPRGNDIFLNNIIHSLKD
ncbi:uncharacterized protein LOC135233090 [Anguilla rostrata]|uniref:uncharacterized protein LOC135233090 n=1 Tax=Anguilla rostrata TaxID=7938 RepID=UPI0030D1FBBC